MFSSDEFKFDKINKLNDFSTNVSFDNKSKNLLIKEFAANKQKLFDLQDKLYAHDKFGLLIILQAIDAAGKDGIIKHVMSSVNPQGCQVKSFKNPSSEELDHDYMWRCFKHLPERGNIAIFNRSYYEEVLICRVHPKILDKQKLPIDYLNTERFWNERYSQINNFELYMHQNGFPVLKFFLYISRDEQKTRFLKRINRSDKNWKFSINDLEERKHWDKYMFAFEQMMVNTSTDHAPWHIIPSNQKWFSRLLVSDIIVKTLEKMNLSYPDAGINTTERLLEAKKILKSGG